jgi:tripartite-type tricarboxylate transporter receptor subunit TctC
VRSFNGILERQSEEKLKIRTPFVSTLSAFVLAASSIGAGFAQSYPARSVRLIVPFPAGATADIAARTVFQKVGENLGQQFVIDNRSGGSTIIGTEMAAKASADGYTLVNVPFNYAANPFLFRKLPYDPAKDLMPIVLLGLTPIVLVVHPSLPARSVKELIALAAANPGKLNYATAGEGSSNHLAAELFKLLAHVDLTHVPYKGAAPAVTALTGNEVALMFSGLTSAITQIQAGRLRALAVASTKRTPTLPDILTLAEAGVAGCEASAWHGTMAPRGTPAGVIAKLNADIDKVLRSPQIVERLTAIGFEPEGGSSENFARFIRAEMEKWAKVIKTAKITAGS